MVWTEDTKKPLLSSDDRVQSRNYKGVSEQPRSCNDVIFLGLFAACCVGMGVISSVAFAKGDPSLLIPSNTPEYVNKYSQGHAQGWFEDAVAQAKNDSDILAGSIALAVVLGFVWIYLLKKFTKLFIYLTLFLGVAAVIGLGGYFLRMGFQENDSSIQITAYCLFGLAALLILAIIFLKNKITLTCAMFTETCRGVQHNPALFPVASIVVAAFLVFATYWVASFIYLYSIPGQSINPNSNEPPKFNEKIRNLMLFMVFGFLWVSAFMSAVFQHSVAGAIASWYFSRDAMANKSTGSPAIKSLFRAVTTSFGSLAFGSLVIALVEFLQFLLRITKKTHYKNRVVLYVISCVQCLLGCIEGIVRYVNKFAYIYVAMHGHSFCHAARECFDLISRNFFSSVIMDVISGFVLFVGKVLFTAVCTLLTVSIVDGLDRELSIVTLSLTAAISFVVLHIISHIIGVGVNTVFVCYLEDLEMNKGSNMYISPDLHQMLQERADDHRSKVSNV